MHKEGDRDQVLKRDRSLDEAAWLYWCFKSCKDGESVATLKPDSAVHLHLTDPLTAIGGEIVT